MNRQSAQPGRLGVGAVLVTLLAALSLSFSGCAAKDPLAGSSTGASGPALVIGSSDYYSAEIIAEIYAQVLENGGYQVAREFRIGSREVFMPEVQAGRIDVIPEYNGNALQYLDKTSTARTTEEINQALGAKLAEGMRLLDSAHASDQDSYNVTRATAEQYGLSSLEDLSKLPQPVTIAANSELATRPYGPIGLKEFYGIDATVTPVEDSGGPLTVKALTDGTVMMANVYSASPLIASNDLVTLSDPKSMVLPQNVTPVVSSKVDDHAAGLINGVQARLSTDELVRINSRSSVDKQSAAVIAKDWLTVQGLI